MWRRAVEFMKEIAMFAVKAMAFAFSKEATRRFLILLKDHGGASLSGMDDDDEEYRSPPRHLYPSRPSAGQSRLPFLDEYRD